MKQIDPNSPAERAYLQVGDIITDLNGSPADSRTVGRYIESHHPNDKMKLAVVRPHFFAKDDHFTTEVTLGTSPCSPDP